VGSSISLGSGGGEGEGDRSVWLFGDSFVERPEAPGRRAYPFVSNTIGLSRCDPVEGFRWTPHWRTDPDGRPRAFFAPADDDPWVVEATERTERAPWYWPLSGFVHEGALFVGLLRVEHVEPRGPFRLPFRPVGVDLARIENPTDDPADWSLAIERLSDSARIFPVSAFATVDDHLYAFAFLDRGDDHRPRGLVRWPLEALEATGSLPSAVETRDAAGRWWPGYDAERIGVVLSVDATEMSLHRARSGEWIAVDASTQSKDDRMFSAVSIRRAESIEGPWSVVRRIRVAPSTEIRKGRPFCYAGKAHPQLPAGAGTWITYVCNLFAASPEDDFAVLRALAANDSIYRPKAIWLGRSQPVEHCRGDGADQSSPACLRSK